MISIKGLDKAKVLLALYNASRVQTSGLQAEKIFTEEDARHFLKEITYFDYLHGRIMKVDLTGDEFDERLYDRALGEGVAKKTINKLRKRTFPYCTHKDEKNNLSFVKEDGGETVCTICGRSWSDIGIFYHKKEIHHHEECDICKNYINIE